jgi:hypothetical protein
MCRQKDDANDHKRSCIRLSKEQAEKFYKMINIKKAIDYGGEELLAMAGPIFGQIPPTMVKTSDLQDFWKDTPAVSTQLRSMQYYMVRECQFFRTFKFLLTNDQLQQQIDIADRYIKLKK